MKKQQIKISYNYKGKNLVSINTTSDESFIPQYIEQGLEDIEQDIRESILDECLGWEKAQAKEHKILDHFRKNVKTKIIKE
tara:strand:+ start:3098 stop:3340 length:243 start_codon:yes stop_codon:yes gene_type:complete